MLKPSSVTRYSASAGSGKTFTLAGIYLDYLFRNPSSYQSILAVTFTNKAAAEMKERILNTLHELAAGKESGYISMLTSTTGKDEEWVRRQAGGILDSILHDYSRFSVGTIDSFFQRVIRAFVRESGLHSGFNLVLDHSVVLSEAVDSMLLSVEDDAILMQWLVEFSNFEIMEGNHWNLKRKIVELGQQIFREEYRLLLNSKRIVSEKETIKSVLAELYRVENRFASKLRRLAGEAIDMLVAADVSADDLKGKSNSILKFLSECMQGVPDTLSSSMEKACMEGEYYTGKVAPPSVARALESGLPELIEEIYRHFTGGITIYRSVQLVKSNLYSLGILSDITARLRENLASTNRFLLSDAGDVLRRIIGKDQTPFVYEKIGTRYSTFMIDEFQDTSRIQWDNFYPLILNSIAGGDSSLVVGDVKQAIYRWRNSDWRILSSLQENFNQAQFESRTLDTNWRSSPRVIDFNNRIFSALPGIVEEKAALVPGSVSSLYTEAVQKDPGRLKEGMVRIAAVHAEEGRHQNEVVLQRLPGLIEEIQDHGYRAGDIGILVRKNDEGQKVINSLMEYEAAAGKEKQSKYSYRIISQDSLILANSPVIKFIVAALRYSLNRRDDIALAGVVHNLALMRAGGEPCRPALDDSEVIKTELEGLVERIRYLPVFDFIDRLVAHFKLGDYLPGVPFLNTLQDMVLELSTRETADIARFVTWWESEGNGKSVTSPEMLDSIQLMTIHKSKGLQFRVVIVPFISWKMDHGMAPSIWVYSEQEPFGRLGAVPVKYKKDISGTLFARYYDRERTNAAIDKTNLLYVALTRAEEALFGFVPLPGRKETSAGSILFDAIAADPLLSEHSGEEPPRGQDRVFEYGGFTDKPAEPDDVNGIQPVTIPYHVSSGTTRFTLSRRSKGLVKRSPEGEAMINYGLLMHDILSRIKTEEEIPAALSNALLEGLIGHAEKRRLEEQLAAAMNDERVSAWFTGMDEYWLERDILLPGGDLRRPDRVVISENSAVVIDYKFGSEDRSYRAQVKEYIKIVAEMTGKMVKGYIWYVDNGKVVEVE